MNDPRITIKGFDASAAGTYIRWIDGKGLHHATELEQVYSYCDRGQYGLTKDDRTKIKRAFNKHLVELEIGHAIPGEYRELERA